MSAPITQDSSPEIPASPIACLGPEGSFSHLIATKRFPNENLVLINSVEEVFEWLADKPDARGIVPIENSSGGFIIDTVDRAQLWRAQTPQAFRADRLARAWANWPADEAPTDDAAVVERDGGRVALVQGDARLMKLTFPEDFAMAEALIAQSTPRMQTRVGTGFDVHRWGPGSSVWLCGVEIPHDQTLIGHSDADAGQQQLHEILGQPAKAGHQAPQRQRDGDDVDAVVPVGQSRHGDAENRIEDRKGQPGQKPELGV